MTSADAARTAGFYVGVLGLVMVGRTVSHDDPSMVQFYCGNAAGTPGSLLSFVVGRRRRKRGITQTGPVTFAVAPGALPAWRRRLAACGADVLGVAWAFGERALCFTDPDGVELSLVEEAGAAEWLGRIRAAEIRVTAFEPTRHLLVDLLGFETVGREGPVLRLRAGSADFPVTVDLLLSPASEPGPLRRIAWRVADVAALDAVATALAAAGIEVSPRAERPFFHEIDVAGPDGLGYALATDGPGFTPGLALPPELEPRSAAIKRRFARLSRPKRA